jgi:hypothetical protein
MGMRHCAGTTAELPLVVQTGRLRRRDLRSAFVVEKEKRRNARATLPYVARSASSGRGRSPGVTSARVQGEGVNYASSRSGGARQLRGGPHGFGPIAIAPQLLGSASGDYDSRRPAHAARVVRRGEKGSDAGCLGTVTELDSTMLKRFALVLETRGSDPQQQAMRRTSLAGMESSAQSQALEIGCGIGAPRRALAPLAELGGVVGVDVAPSLLSKARGLAVDLSRWRTPLHAIRPQAGRWIKQDTAALAELRHGRPRAAHHQRRRQPRRSRPGSAEFGDGACGPSLPTTVTAA